MFEVLNEKVKIDFITENSSTLFYRTLNNFDYYKFNKRLIKNPRRKFHKLEKPPSDNKKARIYNRVL